ncbi:MAG: hypothetical protein RB191_19690, partial [Terriglobia bacterium]|nr:hypothetical protein [Terriglobia bacterium]
MTTQKQNTDTALNYTGEQGYLLLGLLFLFALVLIGLAIAAPKIAMQIQREKEMETIHRGEQYKRAIQLYYRKFGAYPSTIDQLKQTSQIRFLRQEYVDPMTGKKDWKLLHLGQVQMVALGFFGKPAQTAGMPGTSGMPGANGTPAPGGMPGAAGTTLNSASNPNGGSLDDSADADTTSGTTGSSSGVNDSALAAANPQSQQSGGDFGSDNGGSPSPGLATGSPMGGSSLGASPNGLQSGGSSMGMGTGGGTGLGSSATPAAGGMFGSSPTGAAAGGLGGSATGAPIVGVTVPLKKNSMISYRKKKIYNQWQFVYNPQEEITAAAGQSGSTPGGGIG